MVKYTIVLNARNCTFVETSRFTKKVDSLKDSEYVKKEIQSALLQNPDAGDVVKETGGLRKLRVRSSGKGKSGSYRLVYVYLNKRGEIYLIDIYSKDEKADLSSEEKRVIRSLIKQLKAL